MEMNNDVGLRIRKVRETLGLTRGEFSKMCGISESFLATVENGQKSITVKTLYKICTNTKVSADFIVFGENQAMKMDIVMELLNKIH